MRVQTRTKVRQPLAEAVIHYPGDHTALEPLLDLVADIGAAERAADRGDVLPTATTDLVPQHTARDTADHGAGAAAFALLLHRLHIGHDERQKKSHQQLCRFRSDQTLGN